MSDTPHVAWLIEAPNPKKGGPRGYVCTIDTDAVFDVHMTTDPSKALQFTSRAEAQAIIDDAAFIHAMGHDKGFTVAEHMFGCGTTSESDTPRVDAARQAYADWKCGELPINPEHPDGWNFARQLERDLAAANAKVDYLTLEVDYFKSDATTFRAQRDELKAKLVAIKRLSLGDLLGDSYDC